MRKKVALIDDSEMFRMQMGRLLASEGFDTLSYASAEAFLGDPEARAAELIFLDMDLPGIDGLTMIDKLSEEGLLRSVPVVIISGSTEDSCFAALRKYSEDDKLLAAEYYGKDRFSFDMLFVRIRNMLKMREMYLALHPAG